MSLTENNTLGVGCTADKMTWMRTAVSMGM